MYSPSLRLLRGSCPIGPLLSNTSYFQGSTFRLLLEHLWEIIELEKPEGVIVQLGGQTALKLSKRLTQKGIKIIGTSFDNMDIAEDRGRFSDLLKELEIPYPQYGTAYTADEATEVE